MHRRLLLIDIIAAIIVVGGIVGVAVLVLGRSKGPAPTPFPTAQIHQAAQPSPAATTGAARLALGNWPTYGYDTARTRYNPLVRLLPPYRIKWRYKAGQLLEFPPSIYDGDLYFCTEHGIVVAMKASDHHVIWRYRLPPGALFAATPTVDSQSVYVTSLAGRFDVLEPQVRQAGVGPGRHRPHRVVAAPLARPGDLRL